MFSKTKNFINEIKKLTNISKPNRQLNEDENNESNIRLYMNTWGNYNENGADASSIGGGWMTPDKALAWANEHSANEEPFINDVDDPIGLPFEVNEYSNINDTVEKINDYLSLDDNDKEIISAIIEANGDDYEDAKDILNSGDFIYFPGVENNDDLGYEYISSVYGLKNIPTELASQYIDYEQLGYDLSVDYYPENEGDPETAAEYYTGDENSSDYDIGESFIDMYGIEGLQNIDTYFDFESFGDDLIMGDGFTITDKGAIQIL